MALAKGLLTPIIAKPPAMLSAARTKLNACLRDSMRRRAASLSASERIRSAAAGGEPLVILQRRGACGALLRWLHRTASTEPEP